MKDFIYNGCQALEIIVPGIAVTGQTGQSFGFGSQSFLQDKIIVGIETYTAGTLTGGPISGKTIATAAQQKIAALTLQWQGVQVVQKLPLFKLNTIQNSATDPFTREVFRINDTIIDWQNSSVTFNAAPANTADFVLVFGVYWKYQ